MFGFFKNLVAKNKGPTPLFLTKNKEPTPLSLTKTKLFILIDGYCRRMRYQKNYISLDLCDIIVQFYNTIYFDIFIIFEKGSEKWIQTTNELLCFNIENKQKKIIENECVGS